MGEAREAMDRVTAAAGQQDYEALGLCYAENVVAVTPDSGEIRGRDAIVEYFRQMGQSFPDGDYESLAKHEMDNVAIDEGYITATHTQPLPMPSGGTAPPTGKQVRIRVCDVGVVEGGVITEYRLYFDQMELLGQLGLLPES